MRKNNPIIAPNNELNNIPAIKRQGIHSGQSSWISILIKVVEQKDKGKHS